MENKRRYLFNSLKELAFDRGKMAFLSGPRQVGKTTLSQNYEKDYDQFSYKNWDEVSVKKDWSRNPELLLNAYDFTKVKESRLLILDEIHKAKGWKSKLKGLYDTRKQLLNILVTGSAKLNVYKKVQIP